ncbi:hypothetical protein [Gimesia aquarii]|uniref:Glycosyltransferase RgtA/B/C/D-like domain-containing protein n=1 Tax=Gimesia aquarii TaxID=2527964 RepID=A0A517W1I0_9PLAN|nr:hypothetical protein [Gimesia aquarii]QDT99111.1 hypothetical protein V144x_46210 [Gimesia aquarii]
MQLRTLLPFLITVVITICLFWFSKIPLGITSEWTWQRLTDMGPEMILGCIVSGIIFGAYVLVTLLALSRIKFCSRWELSIWLVGLATSGMIWSLMLQDSPPAEYRLSKAPFVLYYKGSSGYFTAARDEISDARDFMTHYEQKMKKGDVLHEGTHPPGLPLFYLGLIQLCENVPKLQSLLLNSQPASFQEATETIAQITAGSENPFKNLDSAVLWLATIITLIMSSLTVIPLFWLSREFTSREVSWQIATFWPLIPATLIFQPKSDALYSIIAVLFLYFWVVAWKHNSKLLFILAGFFLWIGFFLTLAFLPVALCGVFYYIFEVWYLHFDKSQHKSLWKQCFSAGFYSLLGFLLPTLLMAILFDLNLLNVWILNLQNHAGFYLQYPRTYWKWLLVNPIEISLALGLPLSWLVVKSFYYQKRFPRNKDHEYFDSSLKNLLFSCAIILGLLWLSGKNMGEAARLWLVFLPWFLLMTIPYWQVIQVESTLNNSATSSFLKLQSVWIVALIAQAVVCVATVNRITGFHFPPG